MHSGENHPDHEVARAIDWLQHSWPVFLSHAHWEHERKSWKQLEPTLIQKFGSHYDCMGPEIAKIERLRRAVNWSDIHAALKGVRTDKMDLAGHVTKNFLPIRDCAENLKDNGVDFFEKLEGAQIDAKEDIWDSPIFVIGALIEVLEMIEKLPISSPRRSLTAADFEMAFRRHPPRH